MEWNIPKCLWLSQEPSMFWHHLALLQCSQASLHPSWCLQERPWNCPYTRWMPYFLCIQSADPHWTMLCQYRVWAACLCFWRGTVPYICLWLQVHNREQPHTPLADYAQEPGRCTSLPPEYAVMPPGLWHLHQIPSQQRDAHSRCPIPTMPHSPPLWYFSMSLWTISTSCHRRRLISRMLCAVIQPSVP